MLTILTGAPGCGKTTRLLEQLNTLARAEKPALLLVPESGSHQAERRLLQVCGNRGGAYATVTTFSKLTEDVLAETGCRTETLDPVEYKNVGKTSAGLARSSSSSSKSS